MALWRLFLFECGECFHCLSWCNSSFATVAECVSHVLQHVRNPAPPAPDRTAMPVWLFSIASWTCSWWGRSPTEATGVFLQDLSSLCCGGRIRWVWLRHISSGQGHAIVFFCESVHSLQAITSMTAEVSAWSHMLRFMKSNMWDHANTCVIMMIMYAWTKSSRTWPGKDLEVVVWDSHRLGWMLLHAKYLPHWGQSPGWYLKWFDGSMNPTLSSNHFRVRVHRGITGAAGHERVSWRWVVGRKVTQGHLESFFYQPYLSWCSFLVPFRMAAIASLCPTVTENRLGTPIPSKWAW